MVNKYTKQVLWDTLVEWSINIQNRLDGYTLVEWSINTKNRFDGTP